MFYDSIKSKLISHASAEYNTDNLLPNLSKI